MNKYVVDHLKHLLGLCECRELLFKLSHFVGFDPLKIKISRAFFSSYEVIKLFGRDIAPLT